MTTFPFVFFFRFQPSLAQLLFCCFIPSWSWSPVLSFSVTTFSLVSLSCFSSLYPFLYVLFLTVSFPAITFTSTVVLIESYIKSLGTALDTRLLISFNYSFVDAFLLLLLDLFFCFYYRNIKFIYLLLHLLLSLSFVFNHLAFALSFLAADRSTWN